MGTIEHRGTRITLRPLRTDFLADYCRMFSRTVRRALHVSSLYLEAKYILALCRSQNRLQHLSYAIFENATQGLIGAIIIRDAHAASGQLYCWMNETFWGGGRYAEALQIAVGEYFAQTDQLLLTAHVDVLNKRSYAALKKNGFADLGFRNGPYGKQYVLVMRRK